LVLFNAVNFETMLVSFTSSTLRLISLLHHHNHHHRHHTAAAATTTTAASTTATVTAATTANATTATATTTTTHLIGCHICFSLELTSILFVYSLSIFDRIFRMGVQPIARFLSEWFIINQENMKTHVHAEGEDCTCPTPLLL
jgi:hypothetical protein